MTFARLSTLPTAARATLACLACLLTGGLPAALAFADTGNVSDPSLAPFSQSNFTSRYQMTYAWNRHDTFPAAYSGVNSLQPQGEKMYTFSATAHWGWKAWEGGELYLNPEVAQGVPFSGGLIGLGSFTNGEITRAGGSSPKLYRQRLFLRQTWGLGGESEQQEADFNQFAGAVDSRRVVLTVGNFSVLDVFDDNRYAKDPRVQFMNWSHWTHAAYDYAGDARGFTLGAALEWYQDEWVFRVGRFALPKEPNGLRLDHNLLERYGDQIELERAHRWFDQPGKLRLLAYRNHTVHARFDDATARLVSNPGGDPQTILQVRNAPRSKRGAGINLEQALSDHAGLFLRAFKSDGQTETLAFTEADTSFSSGFVFEGRQWGRERDSVGVAVAANGISRARRTYLSEGGISFFIGDGQLQYGQERSLETYYSWGVAQGVWLTADYQRIHNPAYNTSRGPVNVLSARLHVEY